MTNDCEEITLCCICETTPAISTNNPFPINKDPTKTCCNLCLWRVVHPRQIEIRKEQWRQIAEQKSIEAKKKNSKKEDEERKEMWRQIALQKSHEAITKKNNPEKLFKKN